MGILLKFFGMGVLAGAFFCVYHFEGESTSTGWMRLLHWPALLLTGVGPMGLVMMSVDGSSLKRCFKHIFTRSPSSTRLQFALEASMLRELSESYYTKGLRAFEDTKAYRMTERMRFVCNRLAMKVAIQDIRVALDRMRDISTAQMQESIQIMSLAVKLSPSVGMLGTIMGMARLLESLKDPANIGPHMSLALLTTFFGLFFSLVVWTPVLHRLQTDFNLEMVRFEQLDHWLDLLESRKPSEYITTESQMERLPGSKSKREG